jgi:hypothetical protein
MSGSYHDDRAANAVVGDCLSPGVAMSNRRALLGPDGSGQRVGLL